MYPTFQDFWDAKKCASVKKSDILVAKLASPGTPGVMNHAFVTYYKAYKKAADPSWHNYSYEMRKDLQSAACEGNYFSSGGSWEAPDLKGCFNHLAKNQGKWKDEAWQGWENAFLVPAGIANFLEAVAKRGQALSGEYNDWKRYMADTQALKDQKNWSELGKRIGWSKKVIELSTPKLWVYTGVNAEQGRAYTSLMGKWLGYGKKVHEYLDVAMKAEAAYGRAKNDPKAFKQEVVVELAAYVVGKAPIFGSLYAEVIRGVPGLMRFAQKYADQVDYYIRLAGGK